MSDGVRSSLFNLSQKMMTEQGNQDKEVCITSKLQMGEQSNILGRVVSVTERSSQDANRLSQMLKNQPEYQNAVKEIMAKYQVAKGAAEDYCSRFLYRLMQKKGGETSTEVAPYTDPSKIMAENIDGFIQDLNDIDRTMWERKVTLWLTGLHLEDEEYLLQKPVPNLFLRNPRPEDFEEQLTLDELSEADALSMISPQNISAIAVLRLYSKNDQEARKEIFRIVDIFTLFHLGSVTYVKCFMECKFPENPDRKGGVVLNESLPQARVKYHYNFGKNDIPRLELFSDVILPILVNMPESDPYTSLVKRYKDAILQPMEWVSRMTLALAILEAVLLPNEEDGRGRLSHRASIVLGNHNGETQKVHDTLNKAKRVIGQHIDEGEDLGKKHKKLCTQLLEYTRQAVVIFLQLKDRMTPSEKISFLDALDQAVFSEEGNPEVRGVLEKYHVIV